MAWRRSFLFAVEDVSGALRFYHSPRPEVDVAWHQAQQAQRIVALHPPLPPHLAKTAWNHLRLEVMREDLISKRMKPWWRRAWIAGRRWVGAESEPLAGARSGDTFRRRVEKMVRKARVSMRAAGYEWAGLIMGEVTTEGRWPEEDDLNALDRLLKGRLVTELEVLRLAERAHLDPTFSVEDGLAALTARGSVNRETGLARTIFGQWHCRRCGETDQVTLTDCAACGETSCPECTACRELGPVRSCMFLYSSRTEINSVRERGDDAEAGEPVPYRSHLLTPAQARAAEQLESFVIHGGHDEALVWAVTGAGKTEICFPAVARMLGWGGRVLFAVPRRDIVRELGGRLSRAFPEVDVEVLHGGQDRVELVVPGPGTLTVATTHQVLRFSRAFDLVIVDEVDAFPYRGAPMLQQAVSRAGRLSGQIVQMSATPGRSLVKRVDSGEVRLITVPARHHGHPLPVPVLHRDRGLKEHFSAARRDGRRRVDGPGWTCRTGAGRRRQSAWFRGWRGDRDPLPYRLVEESLAGEPPAQIIVFVPNVAAAERVGRLFAGRFGSRRVLWSHARDSRRDDKLAQLRAGRCDIFVSTTILERGVNVPNVDVVVLFADEEKIFDEATLVQMAGRVGRSTERPTGRVHFVGTEVSREMERAVGQIKRHNEEAARLGLLRVGRGSR